VVREHHLVYDILGIAPLDGGGDTKPVELHGI
jgi:hypothetical protein